MTHRSVTGTVESVVDHGTIVQVWLRTEDGKSKVVNFDHSPFRWLVEGEGDIRGRTMVWDPDGFDDSDEPGVTMLD